MEPNYVYRVSSYRAYGVILFLFSYVTYHVMFYIASFQVCGRYFPFLSALFTSLSLFLEIYFLRIK